MALTARIVVASADIASTPDLLERVRQSFKDCGRPVIKVSDHGRHFMSLIPVPLKTRRVGKRCTLNLSRAESSHQVTVNQLTRVSCNLWKQFQDTGYIKRKAGQGRPRATTAKKDCHLSIIVRCNRGATASQLSLYLYAATGSRVSRVTVSKRLHKKWMFARRPAVCVPLTTMNRRVRLAWCRQHRD
ncbi:HTH_Tnp_Tc3_2 domain-containing protein [Trichonephila clavipes]|nr:HTH_Tnp_Tc3_2 domain-containing protein [Trichonephila clavipes]